jgi:hypothetical protein
MDYVVTNKLVYNKMSGHFSKFGFSQSDCSTGLTGPRGAKGDKGEKGATGPQGPVGEKGDKGENGATGPQGPMGEKGDKGDKGDEGCKGDKGETGEKGDGGVKGDKGDRGDAGEKGSMGEKGDKGDKGDKGYKGDKGETGDKGDAGMKGDKGDAGEKGSMGDKGEAGVLDGVSCYGSSTPITIQATEFRIPLSNTHVELGQCTSLNSNGQILILKAGKYLVNYSICCDKLINITYFIKEFQADITDNTFSRSKGYSKGTLADVYLELRGDARLELMGVLQEAQEFTITHVVVTIKKLNV